MPPDLTVRIHMADLKQIWILVYAWKSDSNMSPISDAYTITKKLQHVLFKCNRDILRQSQRGGKAGEEVRQELVSSTLDANGTGKEVLEKMEHNINDTSQPCTFWDKLIVDFKFLVLLVFINDVNPRWC